jgi:hypothetical protein
MYARINFAPPVDVCRIPEHLWMTKFHVFTQSLETIIFLRFNFQYV